MFPVPLMCFSWKNINHSFRFTSNVTFPIYVALLSPTFLWPHHPPQTPHKALQTVLLLYLVSLQHLTCLTHYSELCILPSWVLYSVGAGCVTGLVCPRTQPSSFYIEDINSVCATELMFTLRSSMFAFILKGSHSNWEHLLQPTTLRSFQENSQQ